MKNLLFLAIASICFCSCTKVYECNCEDGRTVNKQDELYSISSTKKSDAKKRCEEYEQTLYANGYKYTCELN